MCFDDNHNVAGNYISKFSIEASAATRDGGIDTLSDSARITALLLYLLVLAALSKYRRKEIYCSPQIATIYAPKTIILRYTKRELEVYSPSLEGPLILNKNTRIISNNGSPSLVYFRYWYL